MCLCRHDTTKQKLLIFSILANTKKWSYTLYALYIINLPEFLLLCTFASAPIATSNLFPFNPRVFCLCSALHNKIKPPLLILMRTISNYSMIKKVRFLFFLIVFFLQMYFSPENRVPNRFITKFVE
jgi:hypothetical protein